MTPTIEQNKTIALITGAGRAPGPALALALAKHGAAVTANDLSPTLLDPLVRSAAGLPGSIHAHPADATRGMPLRAMIDEILDTWGAIDVLINNPRIQPAAHVIDMDEWDWQRAVEMNLNGPFMTMQLTARLMREQGGGVILNIVDTAAERLNAPGAAAYAATQHALRRLSHAAADEFMAYNIRVHTICLDDSRAFEPPLLTQTSEAAAPGGLLEQLVVFLCSPAAAHLSGQEFTVGGGRVDPAALPDGQNWLDLAANTRE